METEIAETVELALIHILYVRAELEASDMGAAAQQRARDQISAAVRQLEMLAPHRGERSGEDAAQKAETDLY